MKRVEMKRLVKDTLFELFSNVFKGTSKKVKFICEHYMAGGMSLKLSSYSYSVGVNVFYSGEVSYYKAYDREKGPIRPIFDVAETYDDDEVHLKLDALVAELKDDFEYYY